MGVTKIERADPKSSTMRSLLQAVRPRSELYRRLGLKSSRSNDLLQGHDPATTGTLARVIGQVVIPSEGRERAGEVVLSVLEELHPDAFAEVPAVTDSDAA